MTVTFIKTNYALHVPRIAARKVSKLSATRDSSDGSSVTDKLSFRISVEAFDSEPDPELEHRYTGPTSQSPGPASSSSTPSPRPPPFSSLYFPSASAVLHAKAEITEPDPSTLLGFAPAPPFDSTLSATSAVEAEVKAALPQDTKGESSNKGLEDGEPPPPYTEGSSPLDGFTYVMAAAGGAASIITQVQQGGPAPVNNLGGMWSFEQPSVNQRAMAWS